MIRLLLAVLAGYLLGSIPSGLWVGMLMGGVDVRTVGSRRTGATNVQRSLGTGVAVAVMVMDVLKGFPAVWVTARFTGSDYVAVFAGVAAVVGHIWPLFAGFRGGRGVATGAGALIALSPLVIVGALLFMSITVLLTRYVSLGSIVAAMTAPVLAAALTGRVSGSDAAVPLALLGGALILFRHGDNLHRILQGTESKLGHRAGSPSKAT